MSMINISHLTFGYDGSYDTIFEDVSFSIDTDWKLGFAGRNGRGKTTFLNLLMGKYHYKGSISASVDFEYFPYEVADDALAVGEVAESLLGDVEEWRLRRELNLLEVDPDVFWQPLCTLSGGERTKVLLAILFLRENGFLLIDEPTNHLDSHARAVLSRYLDGKKGFILVSHDRRFLDGCIDHVLSINRANIEVQKGNFSSWQENRDRQDNFERTENDKLKKEIRHLEQAAAKTERWSDNVEKSKKGQRVAGLRPDRGHIGHQAAKMMKRSLVAQAHRERAVEQKSRLLKNVEQADALFFRPLTHHADRLAEAQGLGVCYGDRVIFTGLNFEICSGEQIALAGNNGSGKSSVLKLLAGEPVPHSGVLRLASGLSVSYVPQDTSFLSGSLDDFITSAGIDRSLFLSILRKLDFERVQFGKTMEHYSGGQKKKALIARSLCQSAHLYIWDEPLNFIDVLSRMQIEQAILRSCPAMIFVEHDISFMENVATRTITIGDH